MASKLGPALRIVTWLVVAATVAIPVILLYGDGRIGDLVNPALACAVVVALFGIAIPRALNRRANKRTVATFSALAFSGAVLLFLTAQYWLIYVIGFGLAAILGCAAKLLPYLQWASRREEHV